MLKGNNTTQCYFGNWTGLTPWCKEGGEASFVFINTVRQDLFAVYCPFPGFVDNGKILLIGNMGLYEYR